MAVFVPDAYVRRFSKDYRLHVIVKNLLTIDRAVFESLGICSTI